MAAALLGMYRRPDRSRVGVGAFGLLPASVHSMASGWYVLKRRQYEVKQ